MGYPVLIEADSSYRALLQEKFNQKLVMSTNLLLGNKSYRLVGTVNKTWFGKVRDYNTLNCMIVDENLEVVKDEQLSKRIYFAFSTLSMIYLARVHISNSRLEDPFFFNPVIHKYEEIIARVRPILKVFYKKPKEYYEERFSSFYDFLVAAHQINIEADTLSRELFPLLEEIEAQKPMEVEEIEEIREIANRFFQLTNQRTLLVLRNEEVFHVMKWILDRSNIEKDIDLKDFSAEIKLMYQIIKGSKGAIQDTRVSSALQSQLKKTDEIIAHFQFYENRGTYVEDISSKQFEKHWTFRKEVRT
ncbi:hypothetical protein [Halalkalibacter alkalisediminis]|uniref:Uncharacterized protein n=1 Tax=Halalkalibacter alkalisediminis TaxID=935616 RepID=A0ABV6NKF0_9BACI|nr:hypothetical protein [Halalkalibacter alkalisediminis]